MSIIIKVKRLENSDPALPLPKFSSLEAAGADIYANLGVGESLVLAPKTVIAIPTGLAMEIPTGFEIQVRPRSGLSLKTTLIVTNSPGTIDSDYRGEIKIILGNWGESEQTVLHGQRIAQLIIAPVLQANFIEVTSLDKSERGDQGFGSTGKF